MALSISNIIKTNVDPRLVSGFTLPKTPNDSGNKTKIDLCKVPNMTGLLGSVNLPNFNIPNFTMPNIPLPKFSLPSMDLPKINMPHIDFTSNFDFDLPAFTKFKIDSLKLHGLYSPFKCSLNKASLPSGKGLAYKGAYNKLGNINCNDKGEAASDNKLKKVSLLTALNSGNCAKVAAKVVNDTAKDLSVLGVDTSFVSKSMQNTVVKSVVDNKFDIGTASSLLTGNNTVGMIASNIQTSSTPLDKLIKVSSSSKALKDKTGIVDYASKVSSNRSLSKFGSSPLMKLASSASKDESSKITKLPTTKSLNNSQNLTLLGKAKGLVNSNKAFDIRKMIA